MSFLENPFAEEEEEAVLDTPFGNYDAEQRESKYNALILSESSLGNRRREVEEGHMAQLHTLVERNTNLRNRLNDLSEIPTFHEQPPHLFAASGFAFDVLQPVLEVLQRQVREREVAIARGSDSTEFGATIPSDPLLHSSHDEGNALLQSLNEGGFEDLNQGDQEVAPLRFDATRLQNCVESLIEDTHRSQGTYVKSIEDDLIYSFIDYTRSKLQQYTELFQNLHTREVSIRQKMSMVRQLKQEGAVRLAKLITESPAQSPLLSSEYSLASLANKDLSEETKRLEVVVALLLKNESIKQKAFEYVEVSRRCRAEQSQVELRRENDELGREVLFLRQLLSSCDIADNSAPLSSEEQPTDRLLGEQTATEKMHNFNTSIVSRIRQVEELLKEKDPNSSDDAPRSSSDILTEIYLKTLERVVKLQNSCLRVFTVLNADLEVRAARASLLTQLVLHNGGFENHMVEAVLDLPSHDLDAFPSPEVSDYFTDNEDDEFFSLFQADLERILSAAKCQLNRKIALGNKVQHLVLQQLFKEIASLPLHEDLGIPMSDSSRCLPRIVLEEDIRRSVDAELATASDAEDRLVADISAAIEEQRDDLAKRLNWINQQSYAESLRQLFALEKQNSALEERLREEREMLKDEQATEPDLGSLEARLQNAQLEVRTLEAEEESLMAQILALEGARAS